MIVLYRGLELLGMAWFVWVAWRVLDDWAGWGLAVAGMVLFPITATFLPIVMLFIPSNAAGALSLWPAVLVVACMESLIARQRQQRR